MPDDNHNSHLDPNHIHGDIHDDLHDNLHDVENCEMPHRPCFYDLTPAQQIAFGNGVGPDWFPEWLRFIITHWVSWFFQDASWRHHDFGYRMGYTEEHRQRYDRLFLKAMLRDAKQQKHGFLKHTKMWSAMVMSYFFYLCVRTFGQFFFNYDHRYDYTVLDVYVPDKTENLSAANDVA